MMRDAAGGDVDDIVGTVSRDLGEVLNVSTTRLIGRPTSKVHVRDATSAYFVDGKTRRNDIVLLVSNPAFPETVLEDAEKARMVADRLDPATAHRIIAPLSTGRHDQRTYVAFPRLTPLSEHRILRYLQKRRMAPTVASWLSEVAAQTRVPRTDPAELTRYFAEPLQSIEGDDRVAGDVRAFAGRCLDIVAAPPQPLFTTVEHGDFWVGNVLFERNAIPGAGPLSGNFFVIDWRGARPDGYPCIDIARFCLSIYRAESARPAGLFRQYGERLGIAPADIGLYCMSSLGRLGMALDQFPVERFHQLLGNVFSLLSTHGLTELDR